MVEQKALLLLEVGFPCSSLGSRVHDMVDSGASFDFIGQSLV